MSVEATKVEPVDDPESTSNAAEASAAISPAPRRNPFVLLIGLLSSIRVRYKIAGTFIVMLSLTVSSLGVVTFSSQKEILEHEMKARASVLVQELANSGKEALLTKQELTIASTMRDILHRDNVVYAMVTDNSGKVFAHNDYSLKGTIPSGDVDKAALQAKDMLFQETVFQGDTVLDAAFPISLRSKELKIGIARIGLSQKELKAAIEKQKTTYLLMALGFVFIGLLISFILARFLTKPLELLSEGILDVAKGDLRKLVKVTSSDEFGVVTKTFNQMVLSLREKLHMEKYLSQSTVDSIKQHRDQSQLKLGGERKYVTALFSDVRGFTSLSEKLSPEEVVVLMNTYLNFQAEVIQAWGGNVDKFVGDEVMAVFEGHGNEINAVSAGVEIQRYCETLNKARAEDGQRSVFIGIGINSGDAVMGNMGSEDHMDYTVIGDSINVAARLCGIAEPGQVLISKPVAEVIGERATCEALPPVSLKGKDKPLEIFAVENVKGGQREYKRKVVDAAVVYSLEGDSEEKAATLKNLSPRGCLMSADVSVALDSKLKLSFSLPVIGDINVTASVREVRKSEDVYLIAVYFEEMEAGAQSKIVRWLHRVNS